jgi:hypothetical protein
MNLDVNGKLAVGPFRGRLTDADILQATREVDQEAKEKLPLLYDAMRKEPSGKIQ